MVRGRPAEPSACNLDASGFFSIETCAVGDRVCHWPRFDGRQLHVRKVLQWRRVPAAHGVFWGDYDRNWRCWFLGKIVGRFRAVTAQGPRLIVDRRQALRFRAASVEGLLRYKMPWLLPCRCRYAIHFLCTAVKRPKKVVQQRKLTTRRESAGTTFEGGPLSPESLRAACCGCRRKFCCRSRLLLLHDGGLHARLWDACCERAPEVVLSGRP